jgi:hypothetical protein
MPKAARARSHAAQLDLGNGSPLAIANKRKPKRPRKPKLILPKPLYTVRRLPLPLCGMDPSLTHSAGHFALIAEARVDGICGASNARAMAHLKLSRFSIRTAPDAFPNRLARLDAMRSAFLTELDLVTREHGPGLLIVEGYAFASKFGKVTERYEWGGQLRLSAYCMGWDVVEVPPSMLKLWTADFGAAKKLDMMLAVEKRWQYKSSDDNDADAFALSQLGSAFIKWRLGAKVTPEEAERFARLEVWEAKAARA